MDLFDFHEKRPGTEHQPLAERMRPRALDEFIGQEHLLGEGTPLRHLIEQDNVPSMIFQGPPSSGKTSLATIISRMTKCEFIKLNAVSLSIAELRKTFQDASNQRALYQVRTIVMIDEIHALKSNVQEALLPVVENGTITLIGCTTESIAHDIIPPLASRCRIYRLNALTPKDIRRIVESALDDSERGLGRHHAKITEEALNYLTDIANGDARNALNALETAVYSLRASDTVELIDIQQSFQYRLNSITTSDKYNLTSALCKSMRGGQTDAALYWMARLLHSGVDPEYIARRIVVHASEDVGMANPTALQMALAAKDAVLFVGMPEARLALAQAVVFICESPKSNSVYRAINAAQELVQGQIAYDVPQDVRDSSPTYRSPHDYPNANNRYLPPELEGIRLYRPQNSGVEAKIHAKYEGKN